jgi:uncharacterized tellurite resistance protein B-like protein
MIADLKRIFGREPAVKGMLETSEPLELLTAALLVELSRADFSESGAEQEAIRHLLRKRFALSDAAVDSLLVDASRRADWAVSLHEFTHRLHRELPESDKLAIVEMLWRVSHADGQIDKHEEHLIRRIAGLLHISDRDRIRMKLKVVMDEGSEDPPAH